MVIRHGHSQAIIHYHRMQPTKQTDVEMNRDTKQADLQPELFRPMMKRSGTVSWRAHRIA